MIRPESTVYLCVLALHIISIVAWMAGLLYLMRLFVYHAEETESVVKERFKVMERRLYSIITLPAMLASIVFGLTLILLYPDYLKMPWLHMKLVFVAALVGSTYFASQQMEAFRIDQIPYSPKTYRWLNEVPTLILAVIVFLVVLKPFS